ncbi:MAG: enoyl-CoA hydratase/isomerase family protein, partial [Actinomycetospora chiangmaiensis]|nr:enoyl-CoA hydratase/isomerase family protein [Actinomycetospora chiangmaiensis]
MTAASAPILPVAPVSQGPILLRNDAGGVATLTLNRPQARNALSMALMAALQDALDAIRDDPAVRVVILQGAGPAFCAGHDLKE